MLLEAHFSIFGAETFFVNPINVTVYVHSSKILRVTWPNFFQILKSGPTFFETFFCQKHMEKIVPQLSKKLCFI